MHTVGLKEATGRLAELIDAVANGEAVVITRSATKSVQCRVKSEN